MGNRLDHLLCAFGRLCMRVVMSVAFLQAAWDAAIQMHFLACCLPNLQEHCGVFAGKAAAFAAMVSQSRGAEGWTYLAAGKGAFNWHHHCQVGQCVEINMGTNCTWPAADQS